MKQKSSVKNSYGRCCRTIYWSENYLYETSIMIKKTYPQEYHEKLKNIASLIREYRLANGYTQMELAKNLNLHRNTLSRVERGYDHHIFNLLEIAATLEINLSELFYEEK